MSGRYISKETKSAVIQRAEGRCEYCKSLMKYAIHTFNIDHIIPLDKKGNSDSDNLALSCGGCNSAKSNHLNAIDPVSLQEVPIFHPRKDNWQDHFSWSDDFQEVIGLTPKGRATVGCLRLNRPGIVNIRKLTLLIGDHPCLLYTSDAADD